MAGIQGQRALTMGVALVAATLAGCRPAGSSWADAGPSALSPEPDAGDRARLLDAIPKLLEAHYVDPEMGAAMAASIRQATARGDYATVGDEVLARKVTEQLRDVSHDRHAMLDLKPPAAEQTDEERHRVELEARNRRDRGFGRTERWPGGVAYLEIESFEPVDVSAPAVAEHMSRVADADALVIDLRQNFGGDPSTVALVASYLFFAPAVHLNDLWWRDDSSTDAFYTRPDAPGAHFGGSKPVFVLVSHETFSAAEEFAYDLRAQHRAIIVGETTAGGAHPVGIYPLSPVLTLRVPTARAINPVTHTDWEGTGVQPDVAVVPEAALDEVRKLAKKAADDVRASHHPIH